MGPGLGQGLGLGQGVIRSVDGWVSVAGRIPEVDVAPIVEVGIYDMGGYYYLDILPPPTTTFTYYYLHILPPPTTLTYYQILTLTMFHD